MRRLLEFQECRQRETRRMFEMLLREMRACRAVEIFHKTRQVWSVFLPLTHLRGAVLFVQSAHNLRFI